MAGIAAAIGAGAAVLGAGSSLVRGLTSGQGGSNVAQSQNSTTNTNYSTDQASHGVTGTSYDPNFTAATQGLINNAVGTAGTPYTPYGGMVVAPFNGTQQDAFWGVKNNPNLSSGYFNSGNGAYGQAAGYDPYAAAQPLLSQGQGMINQGSGFLSQAAGVPNGYQAAQPYANMATGSFTGNNVSQYMDPYLNGALEANNRVANQNLQQNLLPTLNSQFIGSGGGAFAGNNAYSNSINGVLNNWENNLNASNATATNAAYGLAGQNFQADQNRYAGLAGTVGGLANSALGAYGNLASSAFGGANSAFGGAGTAANAANASNVDFTNLGNAYTNAGQTVNNVGLANDSALLGIGNQLQASQQKAADYGVGQYQAAQNWPFQTSQYLANILQSTRVPTTVTSDNTQATQGQQTSSTVGTSAGNSSSSSTPSPLGSAIGLLTGLKGLGVFNGSGNTPTNGTDGTNPTLPDGTPITDTVAKRGGHFSGGRMINTPRRFARGGFLGADTPSMPPFATNPGYWSNPPQPREPQRAWSRPDGGVGGYYAMGGHILLADGGTVPPAGVFSQNGASDKALTDMLLQRMIQSGAFAPAPPPPPVMQPQASASNNGDSGSVGVGSPGDNGGVSGTGETYAHGGHFKFAAGGAAPVIKATRAATDKFAAAARAKAKKPPPGTTRQLAAPGGSGYFR